ncbi:hypothetical protein Tco_1402189 [Tanacetum coccineum]
METLTPRLWIDSNVVDCWVAILNHEELVKVDPSPKRHFFTTGCITQAMIEGRIDEDRQWNMFSAEISAQFKHNLAAKSLSKVELIHMESYIGEPVARWDVSLCTESKKQNKTERDPVKNVVQNQEGDAVKNVVKNQEGDAVKSK